MTICFEGILMVEEAADPGLSFPVNLLVPKLLRNLHSKDFFIIVEIFNQTLTSKHLNNLLIVVFERITGCDPL